MLETSEVEVSTLDQAEPLGMLRGALGELIVQRLADPNTNVQFVHWHQGNEGEGAIREFFRDLTYYLFGGLSQTLRVFSLHQPVVSTYPRFILRFISNQGFYQDFPVIFIYRCCSVELLLQNEVSNWDQVSSLYAIGVCQLRFDELHVFNVTDC